MCMTLIVVQNGARNGNKKGIKSGVSSWPLLLVPHLLFPLPRYNPAITPKWMQCPARCETALRACSTPSAVLRKLATHSGALVSPYVSKHFHYHYQTPILAPGFLPGGRGCGGGGGRVTRKCLTFFLLILFSLCTLETSPLLLRVVSTFLWLKIKHDSQTSKFSFWYLKEIVWNLTFFKIWHQAVLL